MEIKKLTLNQIPPRLRTMPSAPKLLYVSSDHTQLESLLKRKCVAIVGSRKITPYGRQVTYDLASKLAAQGVVIVSGLALGVDAVAHQAALDAGGLTIAVLPSPIDKVYPRSHQHLADDIINSGGMLLSEYFEEPGFKSNFVARNRIVSGLADILLITEASHKSGTMHTVKFANEQGREVYAVPGAITSETSAGTNQLIKDGAGMVTELDDVLLALGLKAHAGIISAIGSNPQEQTILDLLLAGISNSENLQTDSRLDAALFNQTLTMLEISGKIRPLGANQWTLA